MFANRRNLLIALIAAFGMMIPVLSMAEEIHLGSHATATEGAFRGTIETHCIVCHERPMVEEAVRTRGFEEMQRHLIEKGAVITTEEKKVLGTFWGEPIKRKEPLPDEGHAVSEIDYQQFRQILKARCSVCHTLDRVEAAITRRTRFETVEEQMLKRGAVLSDREWEVLRRFWGQNR